MEEFLEPVPGKDGLLAIKDVRGFLGALKAHLDPVFAEQRATWEREGPAAMERATALGITIDSLGGNCPVQAEGSFDAQRFYFRARGDEWEFHAWMGSEKYLEAPNPDEWYIEHGYGEGYDAGWMPQHEAVNFICEAVTQYRAAA